MTKLLMSQNLVWYRVCMVCDGGEGLPSREQRVFARKTAWRDSRSLARIERPKRLSIVHPMAAAMDAMVTIRAHSCNFKTPIVSQTAPPARMSSENPPATPIPAIAMEIGSPASPPVIPMTATKKKAIEPRARPAAPKNVNTAMIVTPVGRFTLLPYLKHFASRRKQRHTAPPGSGQAV
jgi:hypothetical protein